MDIIENVKKAKQGEKEAFAQIYATIYTELYKYALFSLKNVHDAEDCVAEAVFDAFKSIKNLRDENSYKFWFFKILSAKIKRKLKSYTTRSSSQIEDLDLSITMPDVDLNVDLTNALLTLDEENRMIVLLAIIQDYKSEEIGLIMNINSSTVRSKLSRSLKKLREVIDKE